MRTFLLTRLIDNMLFLWVKTVISMRSHASSPDAFAAKYVVHRTLILRKTSTRISSFFKGTYSVASNTSSFIFIYRSQLYIYIGGMHWEEVLCQVTVGVHWHSYTYTKRAKAIATHTRISPIVYIILRGHGCPCYHTNAPSPYGVTMRCWLHTENPSNKNEFSGVYT